MDRELIQLTEIINNISITKRFGLSMLATENLKNRFKEKIKGTNLEYLITDYPKLFTSNIVNQILFILTSIKEDFEKDSKTADERLIEEILEDIKKFNSLHKELVKFFLTHKADDYKSIKFVKVFNGEGYIVKDLFTLDFSEYAIFQIPEIYIFKNLPEINSLSDIFEYGPQLIPDFFIPETKEDISIMKKRKEFVDSHKPQLQMIKELIKELNDIKETDQ